MFKVILCVLGFIVAFIASQFLVNGVQPEVTTTIAMEQFTNPSVATDTAQRVLGRSFEWIQLIPYTLWLLFSWLLFKKNIVSGFKKGKEENA